MSERQPRPVMVIDDDLIVRELIESYLSRSGYEAAMAESGEAALASLRGESCTKPSSILIDLQLPGIAGKALAASLRELCGAGTRIVAMSGSQPASTELEGFEGFLRKPFTQASLNTLLRDDVPSSESERTAPSSPLNETIYRELAGSMNEERLAQLYDLCLDDCHRRIEAIRDAANRNDDVACRKHAHAIQGSCGMVGAVEIASLGELIERHGLVTDTQEALDKMTVACNRLAEALGERGICIKTRMLS